MLGADNQQERLIKLGWVIGFVDGEGCFSIGFIRQPNRLKRKGYTTGEEPKTQDGSDQNPQRPDAELRDSG